MTVRTSTPVRHFGFVDFESEHVRCLETRSVSDGTVDVDNMTALSADQMMMIVSDAVLVQCRGPDRLDSADEPLLDEETEGVVHRLARDGPDIGLGCFGDVVGRAVRTQLDGPQDSQSLRRDMETMAPQGVGMTAEHDSESRQIWTESKNWSHVNFVSRHLVATGATSVRLGVFHTTPKMRALRIGVLL